MHKKIVVIGIGEFGKAIAKTLARKGVEVMAIDSNEDVIESIADDVALAVALDATDKKALLAHNITDFDAAVVAIGQDFEQRLLCSSLLLDLGIKRIITRAMGKNQRVILQKLGIKEILSPEDEVGRIVAERLQNPNILSYLQLPDEFRIAEILSPPDVINRNLVDIDLRNRYKINLITIKREMPIEKDDSIVYEQHILGVPSSDTIIHKNDCLVVFGKDKDIEKFLEINQ